MTIERSACTLVLAVLVGLSAAPAQSPPSLQSPPSGAPASPSIRLNVVVTEKSGLPVTDLQQQDFTVLDNKSARPITSFQIATDKQEPVEVILLMDAVNTVYSMVAYERDGVEKYLHSEGGRLAHPTAIAVLTDRGAQINKGFSTDGNSVGDALAHYTVGLRDVYRGSQYGGIDQMQISLTALHQLLAFSSTLPGRKIILWISPGWPLISGPRVYLDDKQEQQIFENIVAFSTRMREANVTLYNINPVGPGESLMRANYYQEFLKGVSKPSQVQLGDLGLQVLAVQSGGLALESNSDVYGMINQCLASAASWYEIGFDPLPSEKPDQYQQIEIKLDKKGLTARTDSGYYTIPSAGSAESPGNTSH